MPDNTHWWAEGRSRQVGPRTAACLVVTLGFLLIGGCVAAGPPNGAQSISSATEVPSGSAAVASVPASAAPAPSPGGGLFGGAAPCLSATSPAQVCSSGAAVPSPTGPAIPPRTPTAAWTPAATGVPAPSPAATPFTRAAPTPSPSPVVGTASTIVVTQADDGAVLHLAVGQQFLLDLGSSMDWAVTVADQNVVERGAGVLVIQGAQGIYVVRTSGTTILSAVGSPHCTSGVCPLFRLRFSITITTT